MEKRMAQRKRIRLTARLDPGSFTAVTGDVSVSGVFLFSSRVLRPGTKVNLIFSTPLGPAWAKGVVRWAKRVPPHLLLHVRGGMGIELTSLSPKLQGYLDRVFPGGLDSMSLTG